MPTLESSRQTIVKVPFITKTYNGRSLFVDAQRCINMWPETDKDNDFNKVRFYNSPGLNYLATVGNGPHRGSIMHNNVEYYVSGNQLFSRNGGVSTSVGTLATSSGQVSMASNGTFGNQIMITDGTWGYLYNSATVTFTSKILGTGGTFTFILNPQYVVYMNGYFIVVNGDTAAQKQQQFYISAIYDGSSWNSLNFASKERWPDTLSALVVCKRELWLMGTQSVERWYDSGNVFPFDPIPNGFIERGLASQFSVAESDGQVIWLSQTNKGGTEVCLFDGTNYSTVSPPAINEQFRGYTTINDAIGGIYIHSGHKFYQLTFPTANITWVYDISEGLWHEKSDFTLGRHRAVTFLYNTSNQIIVGDYSNGNIYKLDMDTFTDNGNPIIKTLISQPITYPDFFYYTHGVEYTYHRRLELSINTGQGTLSGTGSNPLIMLSYSDDGGHTYGNKISRQVGTQGAYTTRVIWNGCLGMTAKPRTYRLDISEPIKVTIGNPYCTLELGHV